VSDLTRLTAAQTAAAIAAREVRAVEVTQAHLDRIAAVDGAVHAFLHVDTDGALAQAERVDAAVAEGRELPGPLAGVPLAMKDVVVTQGVPTTAGSRILEGWVPPYDATLVARLKAGGVVILGKTNMDEFAMGSSTEHSAYGPTHNPWDLTRIPGGSGGGSAAAVAAYEAPTPAVRSASRRRSPAPWVSSRPTAGSRDTGWSPSPARWTRPARARAPCSTRRCSTRRSAGTTRGTAPRSTPLSRPLSRPLAGRTWQVCG
jgi:hypothetical protein